MADLAPNPQSQLPINETAVAELIPCFALWRILPVTGSAGLIFCDVAVFRIAQQNPTAD